MIDKTSTLAGKKALVTGSTRGLGLVLARGLGTAGACVIVNGREQTRVNETRDLLRSEGIDAEGLAFDITDEPSVQSAIDRIERSIGNIEILVNNAGIQIRGPLEDFSVSDWDSVLTTNLKAAFIVSKAVAKRMIGRKRGKIVNICSLLSDLGRNSVTPYAVSKGGLKMLTRGMCVEWARHNIQVNAIGPGYFETEMTRPLREDESFDSWLRQRTPAGRWGMPEELIAPLLMFVSPGSEFVNGQLLYVDGGIIAAI